MQSRFFLSTVRPALAVLFLCTSLGCIGIAKYEPMNPAGSDPVDSQGGKVAIEVSVLYTTTGVAASTEVRTSQDIRIKSRLEGKLRDTGRLRGGGAAPNFTLSLQVQDKGSPGAAIAAALLTGFTMYVIPSWASHSYTTVVDLRNADGSQAGTRTFEHSYTLVQQLFMVFGMPFAGPESVHDKMWSEVTQDISTWAMQTIDEA